MTFHMQHHTSKSETVEPYIRLSGLECPKCKAPHLELVFDPNRDPREDRRHVITDSAVQDPMLHARLIHESAWVSGIPAEDLAEPRLVDLARRNDVTITELTVRIASTLCAVAATRSVCHHAIEIEGRLCTTLVHDLHALAWGARVTGMIHVSDLLCADAAKLPQDIPAASRDAFEASPGELALSYEDFMALDGWKPANCETTEALRKGNEGRTWGHMIFVSHAWHGNTPGDEQDLTNIKRVVENYVAEAIRINRLRGRPSPEPNPFGINDNTVKNAPTESDYGIWLDYMVVPNDPTHENCERCQALKDEHIARIGVLLTISTIIAMDPTKLERGWIVHEMTGNSHGNIVHGIEQRAFRELDLRHRHRTHLMAGTHKPFRVPTDGPKLRYYEILRLGQMPRCWPAVNVALLEAFRRREVTDERHDPAAKEPLFRHARHFDLECHRLKLAMITQAQRLAREASHPAAPVDLGALAQAVEAQCNAMRTLHLMLGSSAEHDQDLLPITESPELVRKLQTRQFVEVAMGLRAELTRGAGLASWVKLTELVDALAATKFMGRLFNGVVTLKKVSCSVTLDDRGPEERKKGAVWTERLAHARDLAHHGVRADALRRAYEVWQPGA